MENNELMANLLGHPPADASQAPALSPVDTSYIGTTERGTTTRTEAPTNAGTFQALDAKVNDKRLTEKEHDFVSLIEMHWHMYGELPTAQKATELYSLRISQFNKFLSQANVREALEERGVSFRGLIDPESKQAWRGHALSPLQLLAANTVLDLVDTRSEKKKLQDLDIDSKTWKAWLSDPVFKNYLQTQAKAMLGSHQHDAQLALIDKVRSGDIKAIQFYMAYTGEYNPNAEMSGASNLPMLLTRILEIILEEVEDVKARDRISERLMGLGQASNMANQLMANEEPIVIPEEAATRPMSEEITKALERGEGVNS